MSQDSFDGFSGAPPMIIVISGPSGVGKTIICNRLIEDDPELVHSVSATTRPPRPEEKDGESDINDSRKAYNVQRKDEH